MPPFKNNNFVYSLEDYRLAYYIYSKIFFIDLTDSETQAYARHSNISVIKSNKTLQIQNFSKLTTFATCEL
jgi:hypothetical protein